MFHVLHTVSSVLSLMVTVAAAAFGLDSFGALYSAYRRATLRLEDEQWLLQNCKDPVFFSKMKAHPDVCSAVETNARIGAFWAALKEVTDGVRVTWQPYIAAGAVVGLVLFPVCWMMCCATRIRRRQCIPMHSRCAIPDFRQDFCAKRC
jgi:hypothetical protein